MSSRNYAQRELRLLYTRSGNLCAFPGCDQELTHLPEGDDGGVNTSDIAHIVGDSRQGPRGNAPLSDDDRDKYPNLILLCLPHHRIVDAQPRTYSVAVLQQMKADHEARVATLKPHSVAPEPPQVDEVLHSTLLPVTHLPSRVYLAPCKWGEDADKVRSLIRYPKDSRDVLFPFIIRSGQILAFQNLREPDNAFVDSLNPLQATSTPSELLWADTEGHRRYVDLLNRTLNKYLGRHRIFFDSRHKRHHFAVVTPGEDRVITYRPLNNKQDNRNVAWCPRIKKTGERRPYWWHLAAGLRFEQVAAKQWYLAIRPERHITKDGSTPIDPEKVGPRVTRLKAKMYNDKYLAEVQFWRDVLCEGMPRFIMNFGDQKLVCDSELVTCRVRWPGVPADTIPYKNQKYEDDLFTSAALEQALQGKCNLDEDEDFEEGEADG